MNQNHPHSTITSASVWPEHEEAIRRFENAWAEGPRPDMAAFLPTESTYTPRLLVELAHLDLEFRFRAGGDARVEEYVNRFPALDKSSILLDLIASEFRLRGRHGQQPKLVEYQQRFPQLRNELGSLLSSARLSIAGATRPAPAFGQPTGWPTIPGYRIGPTLGSGGMGIVYQADQPTLNRTVAIKTLAAIPSAEVSNRFYREAETVARLDHRNIVSIYEVGTWEADGHSVPYFVMKWYPGRSLDNVPSGPGADVRAHARTIEAVAQAVQHAHERGVLHRDLKPSNILLDDRAEPCVADFGLAGWYNTENPKPLTAAVVGTPSYMAPEQADDPASVTTAADVYGLGAVLYYLLAGRPPFQAETALATMNMVVNQPAVSPAAINQDVPRDLATICLKCLEKNAAHRYRSAGEVADDLNRWRAGRPITARSATNLERAWRLAKRHPLASSLAGATAVALAALICVLIISNARIRAKETETSAALEREQQLLYLERVASADQFYQSNHLEQAWRTLNLCPEHLRKWEWHYLDRVRRSSGGLMILNHAQAVISAAFLADQRVVTADRNGEVRVWNANGQSETYSISGHFLLAHPRENYLAVKNQKGVTVFDVDSRRMLLQLPVCEWISFSADGMHFIAGQNRSIRFFDVQSWQATEEIGQLTADVSSGVLSNDGATLFVSTFEGFTLMFDRQTKKLRAQWKREFPAATLWLTDDGKTLIESMPSKLGWMDTATGESRRQAESSTVGRPIMLPTADPGQFVSTTTKGELQLRTPEPGSILRSYHGHLGRIYAAVFNHDRTRLLSAGDDGTARIWDLTKAEDHTDIASLPYEPGSMSQSANGQLAVGTRAFHARRNCEAQVFDLSTRQKLYAAPATGYAVFDPLGRWLAVGKFDPEVGIHQASDGTEVRLLQASQRPSHLSFRPDGRELVAIDFRGKVNLWNTEIWELLENDPQLRQPVSAWAWSPDSARLAIAVGSEIRILDSSSHQVLCRIPTARPANDCCFDPSGQRLVVVQRGRSLELYNAATGQLTTTFVGAASAHGVPAFHPDGQRIVTAEDVSVRVWDTVTGREVLLLDTSRSGTFVSVAWSLDGNRIYAAGPTLRCWEITPTPNTR
jgi:WD40 repeat protein